MDRETKARISGLENVIELPVAYDSEDTEENPVLCSRCEHVYLGCQGMICGEFMEFIVTDDVAKECPSFSRF